MRHRTMTVLVLLLALVVAACGGGRGCTGEIGGGKVGTGGICCAKT